VDATNDYKQLVAHAQPQSSALEASSSRHNDICLSRLEDVDLSEVAGQNSPPELPLPLQSFSRSSSASAISESFQNKALMRENYPSVCFGFGGQLVVAFSKTSNPKVTLYQLTSVLATHPYVKSLSAFPGPLTPTSKETVLEHMALRAGECMTI
jgi:hypothetical protein